MRTQFFGNTWLFWGVLWVGGVSSFRVLKEGHIAKNKRNKRNDNLRNLKQIEMRKQTGGTWTCCLDKKLKTNKPTKRKPFRGAESFKMFSFHQNSVSFLIASHGIRQEVTLCVRHQQPITTSSSSSSSWWCILVTAASTAPLISVALQVPPGNCITNYPILFQFPLALWETGLLLFTTASDCKWIGCCSHCRTFPSCQWDGRLSLACHFKSRRINGLQGPLTPNSSRRRHRL